MMKINNDKFNKWLEERNTIYVSGEKVSDGYYVERLYPIRECELIGLMTIYLLLLDLRFSYSEVTGYCAYNPVEDKCYVALDLFTALKEAIEVQE